MEPLRAQDSLDWRMRVFDSLSFPTVILKPNRVIVDVNRRFLEHFQVSRDEVIGRTCHDLLYPLQPQEWREETCPLVQVIRKKTGQSVLKKFPVEGGGYRWEDRVFSPILDDEGEVRFVMESLRDVTKVKTLEKTLKETEDFLVKVVESSVSAIVVADRTGEILVMNAAAEDLFGYSVRDAVRKTTVDKLYPEGQAREIMRQLRDPELGGQGKLPSTKVHIRNAEGEIIPAEMTAAIIYEDNQEVATMGIYNDLREKMAVEKQLKAAQEQLAQAEKMASLGQLAAGVAHEINNPLTGILFYANLALESLESEDPIREDLEFVIEDVHRCRDIVKNLLAYSRQENPTKNIIHINDLIDQSLALIRDQKVFKDIRVKWELSDAMMLVHVDKNQFNQVMINLIMNAIASMEEKGTLTFKTYRDKENQKVFLEVSDTGCGIPEENLNKIFDPFFTTKEPGKGTGLGLSTAYGLIQENGGQIWVKETGPEGTTFLIELPMYQAGAETPDDEFDTNDDKEDQAL